MCVYLYVYSIKLHALALVMRISTVMSMGQQVYQYFCVCSHIYVFSCMP